MTKLTDTQRVILSAAAQRTYRLALPLPKSLKGVGVFSFRKLCGEARGAADYLAVARTYHSVILVGIPRMGPENRNEAARFVTLIEPAMLVFMGLGGFGSGWFHPQSLAI